MIASVSDGEGHAVVSLSFFCSARSFPLQSCGTVQDKAITD